ncbi:MAG: gas vesicle protein GvpO [Solirubrobacteraceae bacterium]
MTEKRKNGSRSRGGLSGREAIERVRAELPELLGLKVDSILGLESADASGWTVLAQVLELSRIPSSTDVLGSYEVTVDRNGELVGARRRRRYYRNQADED